MPSQPRNMPEQEHSIKARSHELFVDDTPVGADRATKPFPVYLRETPAQPLSAVIKAMFWLLGIIVALLFLAAVWRVAHRHMPTPAAGKSDAKAVMTLPGLPANRAGAGEIRHFECLS
jgi:hypothetical protein